MPSKSIALVMLDLVEHQRRIRRRRGGCVDDRVRWLSLVASFAFKEADFRQRNRYAPLPVKRATLRYAERSGGSPQLIRSRYEKLVSG
jgi:hypothetical protein